MEVAADRGSEVPPGEQHSRRTPGCPGWFGRYAGRAGPGFDHGQNVLAVAQDSGGRQAAWQRRRSGRNAGAASDSGGPGQSSPTTGGWPRHLRGHTPPARR